MRLIIKIKPSKPIAYANQILANLISHSGKTLASVKLKNRKFKRLRFNLKNASHTDDDFNPNELFFIDNNGAKQNFFMERGQRRNGLNFSPNAPRAFPLALKKRDFSKNNVRRVVKLKSDYFTDTSPIINRTYEFSKAGDYDHLNYS